MDPLWNSLVVGGLQDGKPFLGTITMLGVHYSDDHIATGSSRRCQSFLPSYALDREIVVPGKGHHLLNRPGVVGRLWTDAGTPPIP